MTKITTLARTISWPAKKIGDHHVLLRLGQLPQVRSRLAALEKHGVGRVIGFEEPYCGISVPETQAQDLVLVYVEGDVPQNLGAGNFLGQAFNPHQRLAVRNRN